MPRAGRWKNTCIWNTKLCDNPRVSQTVTNCNAASFWFMNQELDSRYLDWQLTLEHLIYIHFTGHGFGVLSGGCQPEIFPIPTSRLPNGRWEVLQGSTGGQQRWEDVLDSGANDPSFFTITKASASQWIICCSNDTRHISKRTEVHVDIFDVYFIYLAPIQYLSQTAGEGQKGCCDLFWIDYTQHYNRHGWI